MTPYVSVPTDPKQVRVTFHLHGCNSLVADLSFSLDLFQFNLHDVARANFQKHSSDHVSVLLEIPQRLNSLGIKVPESSAQIQSNLVLFLSLFLSVCYSLIIIHHPF